MKKSKVAHKPLPGFLEYNVSNVMIKESEYDSMLYDVNKKIASIHKRMRQEDHLLIKNKQEKQLPLHEKMQKAIHDLRRRL